MGIWEDLFYVVEVKDLSKPRVFNRSGFDSIALAKKAIEFNLSKTHKKNQTIIVSGRDILDYKLASNHKYLHLYKYDYTNCPTIRLKKNLRRRHQRRRKKLLSPVIKARKENIPLHLHWTILLKKGYVLHTYLLACLQWLQDEDKS